MQLRKNEDWKRRLELLQDFQFPAACQRLKISPDGQYIFATGYHPPMLKVYDLANLSPKFQRNMDHEVVDFQILTDDYSKAAFLCTDRTVNLHAKFGSYFKIRVPNLSEGRFMTPLASHLPSINASGVSPQHGLFGCAGEDGNLECFDLRQKEPVGLLDAATAAGAPGQQLTALRFDDAGMHVAVGTENGLVAMFDLRSQRPLHVKDHMYGSKILDIKFHNGGASSSSINSKRYVISSDKHIIKVWDVANGAGYTSIEPTEGQINDVCVWPNSGLIMVGCDSSKIQNYFIPSLGPAPRWCSFLEGLTEELEEQTPTIYDDYRVKKKIEEERTSRISVVRKLPKVNGHVAA
eukprot:gene5815-6101_t